MAAPAPIPTTPPIADAVDALLAAFRALGPGYRISATDHDGWICVSAQAPDADGVARLCAALGAPPAEHAEDNGYTWLRSKVERGGATISITGNWRVR